MDVRVTALGFAAFLACGVACRAGTTVSNAGGVEVIVSRPDDLPARTHASTAVQATHRPIRLPSSASGVPVDQSGRASGVAVAAASRSSAAAIDAERLVNVALAYLGVPYVWGGASPSGFDCSGYTWFAYSRIGIALPRTADLQFEAGQPVSGEPQRGDLVFFQTYDYGASHVGIYLGNGQFINSIGTDVHVASFATPYFRTRYLGARRFLPG